MQKSGGVGNRHTEKGVSLVEYTALLVLLLMVVWAATAAMGRGVSDELTDTSELVRNDGILSPQTTVPLP